MKKAKQTTARAATEGKSTWTFLTNHSHVLILLRNNPEILLREVAQTVGITERAVQKIVAQLEESGIIARERLGRRNRYSIDVSQKLRHPVESHCAVRDLLNFVDKRAR